MKSPENSFLLSVLHDLHNMETIFGHYNHGASFSNPAFSSPAFSSPTFGPANSCPVLEIFTVFKIILSELINYKYHSDFSKVITNLVITNTFIITVCKIWKAVMVVGFVAEPFT